MSVLVHQPAERGQRMRLRRRWIAGGFVAGLVVGIGGLMSQFFRDDPLSAIQLAIDEQRWDEAESLARSRLEARPGEVKAMRLLGAALQGLGRSTEALKVYRAIPDDATEDAAMAQRAIISLLIRQGRFSDAEQQLRSAHLQQGQAAAVSALWGRLLSFSGQQWEAIPYLFRTLDSFSDRQMTLIYLANPDDMPAPPQDVFAQMLRVRDPLGLLGCAKIAASVGRTDQALELIRESLTKRPPLIEAQLTLATLLMDTGRQAEFEAVLAHLEGTAQHHPTYWTLLGRRAQDAGHRPQAVRCYWEALKRQPNQTFATYQLGLLLTAEERVEQARLFSERALRLKQLTEHSVKLYDGRGSSAEIAACARLTYELGRIPECLAWYELIRSEPLALSLAEIISQARQDLQPNVALLPEQDLAARIDLSTYPLPSIPSRGAIPSTAPQPSNRTGASISFADDAPQAGLTFVYFNGNSSSKSGPRMFELTGGGVAAFDYDRDGWCDLYFTQGTDWPPRPDNLQYLDQLYRNLAGQRMQSVTEHCGILDVGFGQGVSAGDFDNDGFPDLYVANIDGNRLYQNQGDGTFRDVTLATRIPPHEHWTTSCLIADLDGDALPDLFDVTYLSGDEIYSRVCAGGDGVASSCPPGQFPAAMDHVYRNRGDGTFEDVTAEWGFDVPNGDGLGIVAADFDDSGRISLFVGNDGRPNFFFVPQTDPDQKHRWNEVGQVSGLALDDTGAAQACMGVAAGDPNNDGRIDLFVTNFYSESNTLYINLGNRTFTDRARSAGLHDPSWSQLGFGTQFVDADLDGQQDIILVNGHVDDFSHKQIPYKMKPQFFHNDRSTSGNNQHSRFRELFAPQIGPFFDRPRLGRGLARLDWNNDGRSDVAITHIGDPAALLTNTTRGSGRGIGIHLVGTTASRDAIGTRVTVTSGERSWTRQLTAGDGYQATNQRRLEFGLGDEQHDLQIDIHWIDGQSQQFHLDPNYYDYIAVQGTNRLVPASPD